MSNQQNILKKMGAATLEEFIDEDLIELLSYLNLTNFNSESLANIILDFEGPECIILNKELRTKAINSLSKKEAYRFCEFLQISIDRDPWQEINQQNFTRNSASFNKFKEWFNIDIIPSTLDDDEDEDREKSLEIIPKYPLFPHQINAVEEARKILSKDDRLILHMPTGAGKTRTAMNLIADFFRTSERDEEVVVWLAHSEELCQQAAEEFENSWRFLGNKKINLVRHFSSFTRFPLEIKKSSFVVMSLQSAHALIKSVQRDGEFFGLSQAVGLTVIDEAHKAIAKTYEVVLSLLAPVGGGKLLGLTATPGRSLLNVKEDQKLAEFFNRQKVSLNVENFDNPIDFLRSEGYLASQETRLVRYEGKHEFDIDKENFDDFTTAQLDQIGKNTERNLIILKEIEAEARRKGRIIVFACSVQHAKLLNSVLKIRGFVSACVIGETPSNLREKYIKDFKNDKLQILINYGVLTTGFDAPRANVAVIARPTQSIVLYSQMVGRVIRGPKAGGTDTCKIITVVDPQFGFNDLSESFNFWNDIWE